MNTASLTACPMSALPVSAAGDPPEWVHLLPPAGRPIETADARGPYIYRDAEALIARSLQGAAHNGGEIYIDEGHATDRGQPAPARGWIKELQARADGIWGRVEWTAEGRRLLAEKAYRNLSPVLMKADARTKVFDWVSRVALVNNPNLRGLTALQQEDSMSLNSRLAEALGLTDPDEDAIVSAVTALTASPDLQSAVTEIGGLVGVAETADPQSVVAAVKVLSTANEGTAALQAELATVTTRLNALTEGGKRDKATAFVDAAIAAGRVGIKPRREHYIARHMADPQETEADVNAIPMLQAGSMVPATPAPKGGTVSLNAAELESCKMLGIRPAEYIKTLESERKEEAAW